MRSKNAIKNIVSSLLLQMVAIIVGFIIPKLLISNFGTETYGLTVSITSFLSYICLLESGFGPVVKSVLYKPIACKNKQEIINILKTSDSFFKKISYIFIVYILLLAIIYPFFVIEKFEYIFTLSLVLIISISTFFEYYFGITYRLYLQAEQKTYIISFIQIICYIINTVITIILVRLKCSIHIIKLVSSLIFVFRPLFQNWYVKRKYQINLQEANKNYEIKEKWDGFAQHIAYVINNNTDVAILTIFSTITNVAIYSVYNLILAGIKSIIVALSGSLDALFGDMIARDEKENLNISFKRYESIYYTLITVIYSCTLILIVPFVKLYTINIHDTNYIVPTFSYMLTLAVFMHSIRLPYSGLTLAAGHFKETRKGAWIETLTNIIISTILVNFFGLLGVAIGTLIAMFIRTIEFMLHTSKYVLDRNYLYTLKRLPVIFLEVIIITLICKLLPSFPNGNYFEWILYALIIFGVSCFIVIIFNFIFYKKEMKDLINYIVARFFKRKK